MYHGQYCEGVRNIIFFAHIIIWLGPILFLSGVFSASMAGVSDTIIYISILSNSDTTVRLILSLLVKLV